VKRICYSGLIARFVSEQCGFDLGLTIIYDLTFVTGQFLRQSPVVRH